MSEPPVVVDAMNIAETPTTTVETIDVVEAVIQGDQPSVIQPLAPDKARTPTVRSRRTIPVSGKRPGKLVIVGSGIKSIAHMTLETVAHIEQADKVFYCVADPGTELFIQSRAKDATDLYTLYDDGKNRYGNP